VTIRSVLLRAVTSAGLAARAGLVAVLTLRLKNHLNVKRQAKRRPGDPARDAGFTLLELLVVMGIMAMLAAVSYPIITGRMVTARINIAKTQISQIVTALELYALDTGTFPPQQVGLAGLLQQPTNTPAWRGPYLKKADGLMDPWGRPYNYKFPGTKGAPEVFTTATDTIPALSSD
jgi:general secretion pathway protein G